jgi:Bifunctional DNA primase/polymerase, N-terminal
MVQETRKKRTKGEPMGGAPRKGKKAPPDFQVRIGEDELGRIYHLRDSLEQSELLIQYADQYRDLSWVLEARGEGVATLDFSQSSEVWGERLMTLALAGVEVELGIKTGLPSRLLVLETPRGETLLDTYGEWRSPCRALAGEDWEQHYFVLPPASQVPITGEVENFHVRIYGQGGLVLAPPSRRREDNTLWTWLAPPWELPPDSPGPPVWEFLEDFGLLQEAGELDLVAQVLPWDQVYALIAPHEDLIRTLLNPTVSIEAYYRELVRQAKQAEIDDPGVLFALLWHAPQGDARNSPGRLAFIRELSAAAKPDGDSGQGSSPSSSLPGTPPQEAPLPTPYPMARSQTSPNDLVEFMENRVVLDRSRYESMIYELAELTAKAEALQRRLEEWELRYKDGRPTAAMESIEIYQVPGQKPSEFPFDHPVGSPPPGHKRKPLSSLKTVVQEFLKNNTDLAADEESVRMLQFCLRNYIDLNPELNGLPLGKKLEMAGKMAREFMTQVSHRGA